MKQTGKIQKFDAENLISSFTDTELEELEASNFDEEMTSVACYSIVGETFLKIGNEKYCYFENGSNEGLVFEGKLADVLRGMEAFY